MASLMENLLEVLEKEESEYRSLILLGKEKKDILVKGDIPALERITGREQDVSSVLRNLEIRREKIMDDMSIVLNRPKNELTIVNMIEMLSKRPEEQDRLNELRARLKDTLAEMAQVNEQNQRLTKQALELVEYDLTLFKSMRQAPETANYNRNAYNTGEILGTTGFDAKQ